MKPICWLLPLLLSLPAWSQDEQSLQAIREAAGQLVMAQAEPGTEVEVAELDPRLRLSSCREPLRSSARHANAGAATIAVQCMQPAWTVYVQVRMSLRRSVVVLRRTLARGEILTADHIGTEERQLNGHFGYFTDPAQVIGKTLRRPLAPGNVLAPDLLMEPVLIRRGELVTLLGRQSGMEVRVQAKALADGAEGQAIQVQNTASGRVVGAIVRTAGLVEVNL
jgi:flagellar basal body P-ring formation protein FlgA